LKRHLNCVHEEETIPIEVQDDNDKQSISNFQLHEKIQPFKCHTCEQSFFQKGDLEIPIQRDHKEIPMSMEITDYGIKQTNSNLNLQTQPPSIHQNRQLYQCDICKQCFSQKCNMESHLDREHNEKALPIVEIEGDKMQKKNSLQLDHSSVHENLKPFECQISKQCFSKKCNLESHLNREHKETTERIVEIEADKIQNKTNLVLDQSRVDENQQLYQCHICTQCFSRKNNLKRHIFLVHKEMALSMEDIEEKIQNTNNLGLHQFGMTKKLKPFKCKLCKHCFSRKYNLERHIQMMHKEKTLPMEDLHDQTQNKNNLKLNQLSRHENLKPFKCQLCKQTFSQKCNLKTHIHRVHNEAEGPMEEIEDDKAQNKNNLNLHQSNLHKNLKPFECQICQKSFSTKNHLKRHRQEVHEKLKPHKCPKCKKCFTRKDDMRVHMKRRHTINYSERPKILNQDQTCDKQCKICEIVFISRRTLQLHLKFVHTNC